MALQLNRHYAVPEDIRKVEEKIAWYKKAIGRYQTIARGDKEGHKELLQLLKDSRDQSQVFLSNSLANPSFGRFMKSAVWAAEVRIYDFIIRLLENPTAMVAGYKETMATLEKQISELRKLPLRD